MSEISYVLDIGKLGVAYIKKDYTHLRETIISNLDAVSFHIKTGTEYMAYDIHINQPLTELYGFNIWVVDFMFSGIDTLSKESQLKSITNLLEHLKVEVRNKKGYFNFRVPAHIMDLLTSFNMVFCEALFCGGIITYVLPQTYKNRKAENKYKINTFYAEQQFLLQYEDELTEMLKNTFKIYQGQYHISHIMRNKAPEIYGNWLNRVIESSSGERVCVAKYNNKIVGFATQQEGDDYVEAVIGGVAIEYQGMGVYRAIKDTMVSSALDSHKIFLAGTQLDNFNVQNIWVSIGMKPFHVFYNFHYDAR